MSQTTYHLSALALAVAVSIILIVYGRWGWNAMIDPHDIRRQARGRLALDFVLGVGTIMLFAALGLGYWTLFKVPV